MAKYWSQEWLEIVWGRSAVAGTVFAACGDGDTRSNWGFVGYWLKNVIFADDQGMVASTEKELQVLIDWLSESAKKYDMKSSVSENARYTIFGLPKRPTLYKGFQYLMKMFKPINKVLFRLYCL